jgi:hypothetical protein
MQNLKKGLALAVLGGAVISAPLLTIGSAHAYTADAAGKGFVGKGEVQSAFGMNNATMQKAVDGKKFTFSGVQTTAQAMVQDVIQSGTQSGTQAATQVGTQSATQSATQVISQDLTCTYTNGNGTKTFHRDGVRDGDREGSRTTSREATRSTSRNAVREGERSGSRAGSQSGSISSELAYDNKHTGQYTGFFLRGLHVTGTSTGATAWDAPEYGDWASTGTWSYGDWSSFGEWAPGDYAWGDYTFEGDAGVEWGDWDAAAGENPADCLRAENSDKITAISNVITPGTVTDGAITEGDIVAGAITEAGVTEDGYTEGNVRFIDPARTDGPVTKVGPLQVSVTYTVTGATKALTPVV